MVSLLLGQIRIVHRHRWISPVGCTREAHPFLAPD